jgi:pyruvate dehydrogenase kinase 2/3/4
LVELSPPELTAEMKTTFRKASKNTKSLPQSTPNLAIPQYKPANTYHPSVSIGHR